MSVVHSQNKREEKKLTDAQLSPSSLQQRDGSPTPREANFTSTRRDVFLASTTFLAELTKPLADGHFEGRGALLPYADRHRGRGIAFWASWSNPSDYA